MTTMKALCGGRTILAVACLAALCATAAGLKAADAPAKLELKIEPAAPDGLITDEGPAKLVVSIASAGQAGQYELRQTYVNRYGEVTDGPAVAVDLDGPWKQELTLPMEYYGPATYRAALVPAGSDEPVATAERMLIRPVPVPRLTAEQRAHSSIGTNVHAGAHWDTLAAMGIHWARDYSWSWLGRGESLPVSANKTNFDGVLAAAEQAGITILPVMQQSFRTKDKMYFITDGDVIAEAYKKFSNQWPEVRYWELDNEADLKHRTKAGEEYARWLGTYLGYIVNADRGLDAAGHEAEVVLNGEAGIHVERTKYLLEKAGEHFGVVNYHYYTGTVAPELAEHDINTGAEDRPQTISFPDQLWMINRMAHEAGKQAWMTEIAWSARRGPAVGDRLQSAYLGRMYLLARWAGTDKTFWFWDRDLPGSGRFSSTGLISKEDGALPAGAAMATVSKFIAQAKYAGSVDIGLDRWCLLFERPEGGWLAAAWAVSEEYDLPETLAAAEEACGMYGNALRDRRLTAEPAYFVLADVPAAWLAQKDVEWLSPRIVNVYQGGEAKLEMRLVEGAAVTWRDLPDGVRCGEWMGDAHMHQATLTVAPQVEVGTYRPVAVVAGDGWAKQFPLKLHVKPAVDVRAEPYTRGEQSKIQMTSDLDKSVQAALGVAEGSVLPEGLVLVPRRKAPATFTAPADAEGAIELTLTLNNGATQRFWLRPRQIDAPRAGEIAIDGELGDWPAGGELAPEMLRVRGADESFTPRMRLAWSDRGLYVAAEIPVGEQFTSPSKPGDFWEWTSIEMSVNAADVTSEPSAVRRHLLWFTPYRDSDQAPWRVFAGEWLKPMQDGQKKTLADDKRSETAMQYRDGVVTIETLIPPEVLGSTPAAGQIWPLTISSKVAAALSPKTVAAWPAGEGGDIVGWGRVTFVE